MLLLLLFTVHRCVLINLLTDTRVGHASDEWV